MKRSLFCFLLLFTIISAKAQLGVQAGVSLYGAKVKADSRVLQKRQAKAGFTAGLLYNLPVSQNISFQPAVQFLQKVSTYKTMRLDSSAKIQLTYTLNYIDLPLNFIYKTNGFFLGAGPDIAYALSGKKKSSAAPGKTGIALGNYDSAETRRFEISANIIAGYQFENGLFFSACYNPGISNLAPQHFLQSRNSGFALRAGYFLEKKKANKN